ncbi:MAG: phosphotransferase [Candidatus Woesearchaeota archaeon]
MNLDLLLASYDIGELISYAELPEAYENKNYVIYTTKGKFVLKLFIGEIKTSEYLMYEIMLLDKLRSLPVTRIVSSKDGALCKMDSNFCLVLEFIEGEHLTNFNSSIANEIGIFLRKLHKITKNLHLPGEDIRKSVTPKQVFENIQSEAKHKELLLHMSFEHEDTGIIHFDLNEYNIFFKNNKITGVIDFDDSFYAPLIWDVGYVCFRWGADDYVLNKYKVEAILEGYKFTGEKETLKNAMLLAGFYLYAFFESEYPVFANKLHDNICRIITDF